MITELVLFDLPEGMTRDQLIANYRKTAPKWRANPDLLRKTYLYDESARQGGGAYLWRDVAAAQRAHDDEWRAFVRELYGSEPTIRYFETPLVVDNDQARTIDAALA